MEERRASEASAEYQKIRRGWCYGEAAFRNELLGQMTGKVGAFLYGDEIRESAVEKAQRMVVEELKKLGWDVEQVAQRKKGTPPKWKSPAACAWKRR